MRGCDTRARFYTSTRYHTYSVLYTHQYACYNTYGVPGVFTPSMVGYGMLYLSTSNKECGAYISLGVISDLHLWYAVNFVSIAHYVFHSILFQLAP